MHHRSVSASMAAATQYCAVPLPVLMSAQPATMWQPALARTLAPKLSQVARQQCVRLACRAADVPSGGSLHVTTVATSGPHDSGQQQQQESASSTSVGLELPLHELADEPSTSVAQRSSPLVAGLSTLGIVALLGGGYLFKDSIRAFLEFFITAVDDWGPWGYVAYAAVYTALEVLAVPAIPLTMTAGVIFGTLPGTAITSLSGTVAAIIAFLIARYAARDKVRSIAYRHPKFKAIDHVIGQNGLKFVTLLRLSPLLPLAASNYLYGLTSVDLGSYALGSWIGMLPGTYAYVHAGALGRSVFLEGEGQLSVEAWQIGLGLGATLLALGFVGRLAKNAIDEVEKEQEQEAQQQQHQAQEVASEAGTAAAADVATASSPAAAIATGRQEAPKA